MRPAWKSVRLRFVADINPLPPQRADLPDEAEVSFLAMDSIGEDGRLRLDSVRPAGEVRSAYSFFQDGDVAFAKVTPCFENGKGALMSGLVGGVGFGTTELTVLRPRPGLDPRFLHYFVTSPTFRGPAAGAMTGAGGLKRVPDEFTRNTVVPLPPQPTQSAISAFLDRETTRIDALIEKKTRFIELLREKRQALITQAVTRGLDPNVPMKDSGVTWIGDVPTHWEVMPISLLSRKITNGYVGPTREIFVESGVRYLQSLHIKNFAIDFDTPYYVSGDWSKAHSKSILSEGDVLIVQTGDLGQVAVVTPEFVGCNCHALIIVTPKDEYILGQWLGRVLSSAYGYASLLSIQTGALHPHLNCGDVRTVLVPVPPLHEQAAIEAAIQARTQQVNALVAATQRSIELLRERRAALITAAVTGQIDIREAA